MKKSKEKLKKKIEANKNENTVDQMYGILYKQF